MEDKKNSIINAYIAGLIFCTVIGIMSVALDLVNLYRLAFFLFVCLCTFSFRKYTTEENPGSCIRKFLKSYIWILMVVGCVCFLNTYAKWVSIEFLLKGFKILVISTSFIEAIYLVRIRKG